MAEMQNQLDDLNKQHIAQFKIKKMMKMLRDSKGNGTSMISLVIPPKKKISDITTMLVDEIGRASNIKDRVNRQSVEKAMNSTRERLKLYNMRTPTNGLILFCGTILVEDSNGKSEKKIMIDFEPFKPVNLSLYFCDNKFHVEELSCLLETDQTFGFVIMDGHGCLFATLCGSTREILHKFTVDLPKKHGRGGQSSVRFARLRTEKRLNYIRKVSEIATQLFIENDLCKLAGIVLAGCADFKTELSQDTYFDPRLLKKIIKIVDVSYGFENGLNQAIELSSDVLSNIKFVQEKKQISKFFEQIAQDTGLYVYGVQETMDALLAGAVETLLVYENLEHFRVTIRNKETQSESHIYLKPDQLNDPKFYKDEATQAEYENVESIQLTEFLADNYEKMGTQLVFITDKSSEGFQFCKGFSGFGGFLRFKYENPLGMETFNVDNTQMEDDFI